MNGQDLIDFFSNLIDQSGSNPMDSDFSLQLLNIAKTKLEEEKDWQYLKKKVSLSGTAGASTTLPTDFNRPIKISSNQTPVPLVPWDNYELWTDGFYVDINSNTIVAIGNYNTTPIMTYKSFSPDITLATSPSFPSRFHALLAYEMTDIYLSGIDGDQLNIELSTYHRNQYQLLKSAMFSWDDGLQLMYQNAQQQYDPLTTDALKDVPLRPTTS